MTFEEVIVEKLQRLPESKREKVLLLINEWIEEDSTTDAEKVQQALAVVQNTWGTVKLKQKTLRWVAEDKALAYDLS